MERVDEGQAILDWLSLEALKREVEGRERWPLLLSRVIASWYLLPFLHPNKEKFRGGCCLGLGTCQGTGHKAT